MMNSRKSEIRSRKNRYKKSYPVFLDLAGRSCVVIGAGEVAERKVGPLLKAGANVTVVGNSATEGLANLSAAGRIDWVPRDFQPDDIAGSFLVIAATNDSRVNQSVYEEAKKLNILLNVIDQPQLCDFFVPAMVERGRLQVAVSTNGASPALAKRLREHFETELDADYGDYIEVISDFRHRVRAQVDDATKRRQAYNRLFASDVFDRIKLGLKIDVEELVNKYAG